LIGFLLMVIPVIRTLAQGTVTFKVDEVICPKVCIGESRYRIVFSLIDGVITSNKGTIQNDTIVDIDPGLDYTVVVTIRSISGNEPARQERISLPICDPILPSSPLTISQSICEGQPLLPLIAFPKENETVDWYDKPTGGVALAKETLQYIPSSSGIYYAESRRTDSGCKSLGRTPSRLDIQKVMCIPIKIKIIRR